MSRKADYRLVCDFAADNRIDVEENFKVWSFYPDTRAVIFLQRGPGDNGFSQMHDAFTYAHTRVVSGNTTVLVTAPGERYHSVPAINLDRIELGEELPITYSDTADSRRNQKRHSVSGLNDVLNIIAINEGAEWWYTVRGTLKSPAIYPGKSFDGVPPGKAVASQEAVIAAIRDYVCHHIR